jgi:hypothetical protein
MEAPIEEKLQALTLSDSELKDLVLRLKQFQSTLTPAQLKAFAMAANTDFLAVAPAPPVERIAELFGDSVTHAELQEFFTTRTDLGPDAPTMMSTIVACIVLTIVLEC